MTPEYDRVCVDINDFLLEHGGRGAGAIQRLGAGWGGQVGGLLHEDFVFGEGGARLQEFMEQSLGLHAILRQSIVSPGGGCLPVGAARAEIMSLDIGDAGILGDVRVLDFTRVLAGPFASMILADLGAENNQGGKSPRSGDEARGFGPFINGQSAYFTSINRGKRSVGIDLRPDAGRDLARALAGKCDVLIENFRPGTMARFGLDYPTMHELYPGLVFVSISGFGTNGSLRTTDRLTMSLFRP